MTRPASLLGLTLLRAAVLVGRSGTTSSSLPPSTAPAPSTSSATTPVASTLAATAAQSTSRTDPAGDGGSADLTAVTIDADSAGVRVTWATAQPVESIIAAAETGVFNVTVIRADPGQVNDPWRLSKAATAPSRRG